MHEAYGSLQFIVAPPSVPLCLLAHTLLLLSLPHFHSLIETFLLLEFSYDVYFSWAGLDAAPLNVEHETEF